MKNLLYQVTGVVGKQLDNSRVVWGPVPPVHALSQSIIPLSLNGEASLTLCVLQPTFLQPFQLPSKFSCSWNLQGRRWYHREGILQNNCLLAHEPQSSAWEGIMQEVSDYRIVVCNADVWVWLKALLAVHMMNFPLSVLNDHSLFFSSEYFVSCHGPQVFFLLLEFSDRKCTNAWGVTGRKDEGVRQWGRKEGRGKRLWPRQDCEKWGRTWQQQRARTSMNCYPGHLELWGTERMEKSIFSSVVQTSFWP